MRQGRSPSSCARSKAEHELLFEPRDVLRREYLTRPAPEVGADPPRADHALSAALLTELLNDESLAKQGARAVIVKAFEMDYPGAATCSASDGQMRVGLLVEPAGRERSL